MITKDESMKQDEIVEMAKKAGLSVQNPQFGYSERHHIAGWITDLEAFAKLVAAKEREECALICDNAEYLMNSTFAGAAAAIRARGKAT